MTNLVVQYKGPLLLLQLKTDQALAEKQENKGLKERITQTQGVVSMNLSKNAVLIIHYCNNFKANSGI